MKRMTINSDNLSEQVYEFNAEFLGKITDLIERYNSIAEKLEQKPLSWNVEFFELNSLDGIVRKIRVTFEGSPLKIGEWNFVATLEHTESGNIVRALPNISLPKEFFSRSPKCEHCKVSRHRKDTYIVQNVSGEFLQVGKNCLKDFTGHNPALQLAFLDMILAMTDSEFRGGRQVITPFEVVRTAAAEAIRIGWAKDIARSVWHYNFPTDEMKELMRNEGILLSSPAGDELAKKALDWISSVPEDQLNDFLRNVKTSCALKVIEYRNATLCAWVVGAYLKEQEQELLRARKISEREKLREKLKNSKWVGEIKERLTFDVEVIETRRIGESNYGYLHLHKFLTATGDVLTWITSDVGNFEIGQKLKIKGTIKSFGDWQEIKETKINRVKVEGGVK